jgi:hypothetical protein
VFLGNWGLDFPILFGVHTVIMNTLIWIRAFLVFAFTAVGPALCAQAAHKLPGFIQPGAVWRDTQGHQIQAHGGGILYHNHVWYWFGEDRTQGLDPDKRYVACYSSRDLIHWTFRGRPLQLADPDRIGSGWVLERPKVFYSPSTRQFVMYFHLDDSAYKVARVATAISSTPTGPYRYLRSFRPLGLESRDIGQFEDDDGSDYLIFESRPSGGFYIAGLSPDRLSIVRQVAFLDLALEGGAVVHYRDLYYVLGSHLTGWNPNPNVYSSAPSLAGPWTHFLPVAPAVPDTYGAQSGLLLKVTGNRNTAVIFMGDVWKPSELWDSRYLWMPVQIGEGKMELPPPAPWTIDVTTGVVTVNLKEEIAKITE